MSLPNFTFTTTAEEVAASLSREIRGKNVLITGTSLNGIGFEAARVIAKYANLVIITGYNLARLKLSEEAIQRDVPSANIRPLELDLCSLAAIRKATAEVNAWPEPLHVLIHNAAAAVGPFKLSADGFESQMATAQIGPFLLTKLLTPKLLAAASATPEHNYVPRVVFVSSAAHARSSGVDLATLGRPNAETYELGKVYGQAKSANVLMAIELSRRSKGAINAYSLHPGTVSTNINQKPEAIKMMQSIGLMKPDGTPNNDFVKWKTIPQGAATTIAAAFDPRLDDKPGAYLADSEEANHLVGPHCRDPDNAEKLWDATEEIIGERFVF